jgi:KUP system potassium uptake protein
VLHERVLILTIATLESPTVKPVDRVRVEPLTENVFRIKAYYGFMETPNIREIIDRCNNLGLSLVFEELTFFLGREILVDRKSRSIPIWQELLFAFMNRNAQRATAFFKIPPDQVIEVGMQVEF